MLKSLIVSIHLMLLFISPDDPGKQDPGKFQYISCYSLSWSLQLPVLHNYLVSIHLMLLFIFKLRSVHLVSFSFQYISCYSLSWSWQRGRSIHQVSIHLMLLFIQGRQEYVLTLSSFNTSHVTLYRYISLLRCYFLSSFNTSHVTLYRRAGIL